MERVDGLSVDARDWYEERAGILEYDTMIEGRYWYTGAEAEELALAMTLRVFPEG